MGIDLVTTTLWAELATWRPPAIDVITHPQHWAIHGTTRMGKALTFKDRLEDEDLDELALSAGVKASRVVMDLLARADGIAQRWEEAPPGPIVDDDVRGALDDVGTYVAKIDPVGLELLVAVAHAQQAGTTLEADADEHTLRAAIASPARTAPKPSGPSSAILAASIDTLWVPTAMKHTWDSPACVLASTVQLRDDLAALPALLHHLDPKASADLVAAQTVVLALTDAIAKAGPTRCVRMAG